MEARVGALPCPETFESVVRKKGSSKRSSKIELKKLLPSRTLQTGVMRRAGLNVFERKTAAEDLRHERAHPGEEDELQAVDVVDLGGEVLEVG